MDIGRDTAEIMEKKKENINIAFWDSFNYTPIHSKILGAYGVSDPVLGMGNMVVGVQGGHRFNPHEISNVQFQES